jgi:hypothetical protein
MQPLSICDFLQGDHKEQLNFAFFYRAVQNEQTILILGGI